jgi:hypothetical protein
MADRRERFSRLIIMVKEPRLGAVKTRLARQIGPSAATGFYRNVADRLIRRLAFDARWNTLLAIAPDTALFAPIWPAAVPRIAQGSGDIGVRMERLLRESGHVPRLLIGSDIPGVRAKHIADAFAMLRRNDVVLGPAEDGGFWLVGLTRVASVSGLFQQVRWSSPFALADTVANTSGRRVGFAATLSDVDDRDAYRRIAWLGARATLPA